MPRLISLTDDRNRDAQVAIESPRRKLRWQWRTRAGRPVAMDRFLKGTDQTAFETLLGRFGDPDAVGQAMVDADPEVDLERVGRRLGPVDRVWVRPDGTVLYSARALQVVYGPDGTERSREDFVDVDATVAEETPPLPWTGRLLPVDEVVRRFVLGRKVQLRHVNGLTFDFLYDIASKLQEQNKMLLVGAGPRGAKPLIFHRNGSPHRGFLEGRVEGDGFRLVLHLSNLELKRVPT